MEELNQKEEKLTSRSWAFYNLLKSDPDKWFTQEEICKAIPSFNYIDDERNHCVAIGEERLLLNASPLVDKIIVTKNHKFKIATYEEYMQERAYHIRRLKCQVAQVEAMDRKFSQNNQVKLFNNILEELKPGNEQYHETFFDCERKFLLIDDISGHISIVKCNQVIRTSKRLVKIVGGELSNYVYNCDKIDYAYNLYQYKNYSVIELGKD